ncbi:sensor histidine kinase [uncultured Algibacter sp.]|jgi:signal transduction histidine kinase|uniref:sensor histidine kinase n=1 Tax=uncultured Algibacter sp. TaxID=298659 RepID=UPI0025CBF0AD|nr:sensor histidine kinase [uncultured Algibacter sp.]
MKVTLSIIFFLCAWQITAQDADIKSKIDFFNSKIVKTERGERLAWLDSLTRITIRNSDLKYDSIVRQTISFAISLDSLSLATKKLADLIGFENNYKSRPEEGLKLFKTYEEVLNKGTDFGSIGWMYLNAADSYYFTDDIDKSLELYEITKTFALKAKSKGLFAYAELYTGYNQSHLGKFSESSISLKKAMNAFSKLKDTFNILSAKNALSILYSKNAFYKEAEKERNEAIELAEKTNNNTSLVNLYFNAAQDYKKTNDNVKQIINLKKSLLANSNSDFVLAIKPVLISSLVKAYAENDSLSLAKTNFKEFEKLYRKNTTEKNRNLYVDAKKTLLFFNKDYQNALIYGKEFLKLEKQKEGYENIMNAEIFLSKVYEALGDNYNSNIHLLNHYAIKDSITNVQNVKSLVYYQTLYETEKRDHQIENQQASIGLLNLENKNKRQFIIFGSIGLVIFFSLVIVLRSRKNLKERQAVQEAFSQNLISAREEERTTVARDLHDSVGQKLMLLTKITRTNKNNELETLSSSSLEELRTVLRGLHPPAIKDLGITKAIEALVNEVDSHTDIFFTNDIENIDNILSNDNALHLYRIIQESLNNIVKHANAKATFVNIEKVKKQILVEIKDNGNGFDFSKNTKHGAHFGMKTLKERAKIIRSKLDIVSQHNQGTVIKLVIPI